MLGSQTRILFTCLFENIAPKKQNKIYKKMFCDINTPLIPVYSVSVGAGVR